MVHKNKFGDQNGRILVLITQLLSFLNAKDFAGFCFEYLQQLSFVLHDHRVFFDSVAPGNVTSSLPLKDLTFRANRNGYFLPSPNF